MRMIRARKGQSTAEYAVLFAIVLGAAVAMQQYVRLRLQGSTKGATDIYRTQVGFLLGDNDVVTFSPDRVATSASGTDVAMDSATRGSVESSSTSTSIENATTAP